MKASIVAGILIILLVALVTGNAYYVGHITDAISLLVETLPETPTPEAITQMQTISEQLHAHRPYLSFFISFSLIDRVLELSDSLLLYGKCYDVVDYQVTKALLSDAIDDMRRLEEIIKG